MFLYPFDITFKRLWKSTSYFGYNPRRCFIASRSVIGFEEQLDRAKAQITNIGRERSHILKALILFQTGDDALSDVVFQLRPTNMLRQLGKCACGPVSPWVFEYLLTVCENHEVNAAAEFYHTLSVFPWAGSIRGYLFERQVFEKNAT